LFGLLQLAVPALLVLEHDVTGVIPALQQFQRSADGQFASAWRYVAPAVLHGPLKLLLKRA
jgi:hypothetical protein